MLEREHLPAKLAEESGCYVPTKAAWGFIDRMARQEGVRDLAFLVGYDGGLRLMGPTLAGQICRASTLAQALRRFCRFVRLESSEMKCWLTVEQEEARFHLFCTPLRDPWISDCTSDGQDIVVERCSLRRAP